MSYGQHTIAPTPAQYIDWGYRPIPLIPGNKAPRIKAWTQAPVDVSLFRPGDGVGIVCGLQPNGSYLNCLDYDHRPEVGVDAKVNAKAMWELLPDTIKYKLFLTRSTSGNGYHIWGAWPLELPKGKLYNANGTHVGELLGTGAQIVAQPPEHWRFSTPRDLEPLTVDEAAQVLEIIGYRPKVVRQLEQTDERTDRPGDDYNNRGDFPGLLEKHGWRKVREQHGASYWCRPGKTKGISASYNHVPGVFYVFSSNADPFTANTGYRPFRAYVLLEHGGNYQAAAGRLADQGYGAERTTEAARKEEAATHQAAWVATKPGRRHAHRERELAVVIEQYSIGKKCGETNAELAAHMGRSERSITRYLTLLVKQGRIRYLMVNGKRWVELTEDDHAESRRMDDAAGTAGNGSATAGPTSSASADRATDGVQRGIEGEHEHCDRSRHGTPCEEVRADVGGTGSTGSGTGGLAGVDNNAPQVRVVRTSVDHTSGGVWGGRVFVALENSTYPLCEQCEMGELAPDERGIARCTYCEQAMTPARIVAEALDEYGGIRSKDERIRAVLHYVLSNGRHDLRPEYVVFCAERITEERRRITSDERYREKLRAVSDRALNAKEKSVSCRAEEYYRNHDPRAPVFSRMAWMIGQEQERREPLRKVLGRRDKRQPALGGIYVTES